MHSSAKGKHGSKKPLSKEIPEWVEFKPKEIIELIASLANQGHNASEIGSILRDQYGVPSVRLLAGKRVSEIMKEQGLLPEIPEDLMSLIKTSVRLQKHLQENSKDFSAKRGYQLAVSKIRRLAKYYVKKKKLHSGWKYTPETAQLLVK
ncbi:MAG: 30S ribosomal protein S15, small subunit ribosomal protein S15 [archaeon GW2011_AR21]|nr:MAG: 30S ribosomal protein S15, small subunit ribosomal protein S15 [archaeon GW2011_AR21]